MRSSHLLLCSVAIALAGVLSASTAAAQGTPFGNGTNATQTSSDDDGENPDKGEVKPYYQRKSWSVGSSFETNRTLLQEDVGGRIKAFNTLSLYAAYNITPKDQVRATGGFIQRFIADQTETGIRTDDVGLSYAHRFQLPWQMMLAPSVANSFPTSFNSQLMGLIALPRAGLFLSRSFLDNNLTVSLRGGASYYVVEYRQAVGQVDANPRATTNAGFNINYSMPFHQALQVGVSGSTSYLWQYDVDHANDPVLREQFKYTPVEPSADPYYGRSPPTQQGYGGEVYISYNLPSLEGINTNLQIALSQNDGVLRDGATHLYWLSRRGGQASAALTVSY
jgi:hypothetical protein